MRVTLLAIACLLMTNVAGAAEAIRLKELVRIQGERDYALVGYGLVVGLAGTGDSERNKSTRQSLVNTLKRFNLNVSDSDLSTRNTAAVMVTGTMRSFSEGGDKLDVEVSSLGDARSLLGGTLLLTPLNGPDDRLYALAQGPVSVGGHVFEVNANLVQKNHPTVGRIPRGATLERAPVLAATAAQEKLTLILHEPDYTTAQRIADTLFSELGLQGVRVVHAAKVELPVARPSSLPRLIAQIEGMTVRPDYAARIVINERTGTVVAGSNVRIGEVNISQGNLNVVVSTRFQVSQPSFLVRPGQAVGTVVVPETRLDVKEQERDPVQLANGTTVGELVQALYHVRLSIREVITVLQAIKQAGALHAELVIQ